MGLFIDNQVQAYSFRPPKNYKPTKQAFWCTRNLHGIVWNSGRLDYSELSNVLTRVVNDDYFAKGKENARFLAFYWIERWKIW